MSLVAMSRRYPTVDRHLFNWKFAAQPRRPFGASCLCVDTSRIVRGASVRQMTGCATRRGATRRSRAVHLLSASVRLGADLGLPSFKSTAPPERHGTYDLCGPHAPM